MAQNRSGARVERGKGGGAKEKLRKGGEAEKRNGAKDEQRWSCATVEWRKSGVAER